MLILQLGLMGMFVLATYHFTQKELTPSDVYVYTKRVEKNAELEESDFIKKQIPAQAKSSSKGFLTDKEFEKIKEGGMVASTTVEAGQYAYSNQITPSTKIDPFDQIDLSKYRKISLPVSYETALSGEIKRGDRVDLAYIGEVETQSNTISGEATYSNIFLQNVLVHSVTTKDGFEFVGHSEIRKSQLTTGDGEVEDLNSIDYEEGIAIVTLAVPIENIEEILARDEKGIIRVVGRYEESVDKDSPGYLIGVNGNNPLFAGNKKIENSFGY